MSLKNCSTMSDFMFLEQMNCQRQLKQESDKSFAELNREYILWCVLQTCYYAYLIMWMKKIKVNVYYIVSFFFLAVSFFFGWVFKLHQHCKSYMASFQLYLWRNSNPQQWGASDSTLTTLPNHLAMWNSYTNVIFKYMPFMSYNDFSYYLYFSKNV